MFSIHKDKKKIVPFIDTETGRTAPIWKKSVYWLILYPDIIIESQLLRVSINVYPSTYLNNAFYILIWITRKYFYTWEINFCLRHTVVSAIKSSHIKIPKRSFTVSLISFVFGSKHSVGRIFWIVERSSRCSRNLIFSCHW